MAAWVWCTRERIFKLSRFLALKFVTDEVAKDPQALSRFLREGKAASALNDPDICTIYEIDDQYGEALIAKEFLDGITLKHRIPGRLMETQLKLDGIARTFGHELSMPHAAPPLQAMEFQTEAPPSLSMAPSKPHRVVYTFGPWW
jgi:hypothetical protein